MPFPKIFKETDFSIGLTHYPELAAKAQSIFEMWLVDFGYWYEEDSGMPEAEIRKEKDKDKAIEDAISLVKVFRRDHMHKYCELTDRFELFKEEIEDAISEGIEELERKIEKKLDKVEQEINNL